MACRISELVLKCRDPEVLARFWCEVLDFIELDREEEILIEIGPREGFGGPQPTIILIRNDEPKNGHARLHIDVNPTDRDQDAELARLLAAGAETRRHRSACGGVLARPRRSRRQRVLPAQAPPRPTLTAIAQTIDLGIVGPVDVRPSGQPV